MREESNSSVTFTSFANGVKTDGSQETLNETSNKNVPRKTSEANSLPTEDPDLLNDSYTVSLDIFKSVFEHEGTSFYLRLGTLSK